jgi:D-arabinose 1-dehydrogenase-like Zn-dependent alcohol dehydrogenase
MADTMRAQRFYAESKTIAVEDVPIPEPGPGVTGWAEGDRVVVAAGRPCTECVNCRRGDVSNCLRIRLMAFAYDGAWAEYTVAQAIGLTRIPDNVPLEQAAILADAVSTPFGAVVRTAGVGIGESVGVWGVGGVGTHIVQLARLVARGRLDLSRSISDVVSLEDVAVGSERLEKQDGDPIRILVRS